MCWTQVAWGVVITECLWLLNWLQFQELLEYLSSNTLPGHHSVCSHPLPIETLGPDLDPFLKLPPP